MKRIFARCIGSFMLAVASYIWFPGSTHAQIEWIGLPDPPNVQATMELVQVCKNGITMGFYTVGPHAVNENGDQMGWDISFDRGDGNLLIFEYPLWLSEREIPLQRGDLTFPHERFLTLLWGRPVQMEQLDMCVAGAGTGFCATKLPLENCLIAPELVVDIVQIGPQDTTPMVSEQLVYEVWAYDSSIGTVNGTGIETVVMTILDHTNGQAVFATEPITASTTLTATQFCAFSDACGAWDFAENDYTWPNGTPIENGRYTLRAEARTPEDRRKIVQVPIEISGVPNAVSPVPSAVYIHIPAGEFIMGSEEGANDEKPIHAVELDEFWIMETEVTNAQYAACIEANVCTEPNNVRWRDPALANHPVTGITWEQANTYATWGGGRLPTEAEWEKAARGTDGRSYPWGNENPTVEHTNFRFVTGATAPVGTYPAGVSPYGVLDMAGNVEEWVADWYADDYYATSPRQNPQGPESGLLRVLRGGSFKHNPLQIRSAARYKALPDSRFDTVGFRVALSEPPGGVQGFFPGWYAHMDRFALLE